MLINTMVEPRSFLQSDHFEEFLDIYSVRETCSMLLQLIVEKEGFYMFSKKFEESILMIRKREQLQHQPR